MTKSMLKGLPNNQKFAIALSGGVDSVCLLDLAAKTLPRENLFILHFNHLTRGPESYLDEALALRLAEKYGLPITVERRKGKGKSEDALRRERHKFLRNEAKRQSAYVLLAHHLDDQLETFLFRLIRGSQLKGLSGMRKKNGRFLRPLLSFSKEKLLRYAKQNNLEFREDKSNEEAVYFRNRIRRELVPVLLSLAEAYGGKEKFYGRFGRLLKESRKVLQSADKRYDRVLEKSLTRTKYFDRLDLKEIPLGFRQDKGFVRRFFEKIQYEGFDSKAVKAVRNLLKENDSAVSLTLNRQAEVSCGFLYLQNPRQRALWEKGPELSAVKMPLKRGQLSLRTFIPGDRFKNKKLKREFLKRGVPRLERRLLPLVLRRNTNEVVWFVGLPTKDLHYTGWDFPHAHLS